MQQRRHKNILRRFLPGFLSGFGGPFLGRFATASTNASASQSVRKPKARGFSLIESVVSGSILLIGVTGIVSGLGTTMRLKEHNYKMTAAIHAGEATMEELLLRPTGDPQMVVGGPYAGPKYNQHMQRDTNGHFQTQWTVAQGPVAGTRTVTVQVVWTEAGATPKSIQLTSHRR
jgi:Tfp pilus assembly protein PilV